MSNPSLHTTQSTSQTRALRIAVEGCGHGCLDLIYTSVADACSARGWPLTSIDMLIICGDFQAVRNARDLNCMSVPRRYREMADFHAYYSGASRAPVLTLVVGGNHEASNYFSELQYGGWLAPNIYYLGAVGVVRYGPMRIAGLSGIHYSGDYRKPRSERLPYDRNEIRSVFHVREAEVKKLLSVREPVDVCLSHDWPRRVEWFGDYKKLFKDRPGFWESVKTDRFGSVPAEQVMNVLRPRYWFAGHMHIKYAATVAHKSQIVDDILTELDVPSEIGTQLPSSMFRAFPGMKKTTVPKVPKNITNTVTQFLALDKPGADREFLNLIEIEPRAEAASASQPYMQTVSGGRYALCYDEEWLSILRATDGHGGDRNADLDIKNKTMDRDWIQTNITAKGLLKIPENFQIIAPVYDPDNQVVIDEQPPEYPNNQTKTFCEMLEIRNMSNGSGEETTEGAEYIMFE